MDERETERAESELRRTLSSLDGVSVPSLAAVRTGRRVPPWRGVLVPLATGVVVLFIAVAVGQTLALWRSDRGSSVAASPSATAASPRYLDVDGYRFTVTLISDPAYGPTPAAPYAVSAITGVGVRCDWTRTGADVAKANDVWGTTDAVVSTSTIAPVPRGWQGNRTNGVPAAAVDGSKATMVCGLDDDSGGHGVVIDLAITPDGKTVRSLELSRWSGILGDTSAIAPCTGKAGTARLLAAFASTAAEVATWVENAAYPNAPQDRNSAFRTAYAPTAPIYLCYFSGSWAPPIGPVGSPGPVVSPGSRPSDIPLDYDRARFFVDANGNIVPPSTYGSSAPTNYLPFVRPGGRF